MHVKNDKYEKILKTSMIDVLKFIKRLNSEVLYIKEGFLLEGNLLKCIVSNIL